MPGMAIAAFSNCLQRRYDRDPSPALFAGTVYGLITLRTGGIGINFLMPAPPTKPYTLNELMVVAAAREIKDGEVVFVGMRLPLIAFVVAKKTHAPKAIGLFENGVVRSTPSPELIYTMADPPNILNATQCLDMLGVMSLLQSGRVDLGFLGAAEVDRFGNLNSTQVHGRDGKKTRLPGSGGACDIAS